MRRAADAPVASTTPSFTDSTPAACKSSGALAPAKLVLLSTCSPQLSTAGHCPACPQLLRLHHSRSAACSSPYACAAPLQLQAGHRAHTACAICCGACLFLLVYPSSISCAQTLAAQCMLVCRCWHELLCYHSPTLPAALTRTFMLERRAWVFWDDRLITCITTTCTASASQRHGSVENTARRDMAHSAAGSSIAPQPPGPPKPPSFNTPSMPPTHSATVPLPGCLDQA